jgi:uncharacterized membrane protein
VVEARFALTTLAPGSYMLLAVRVNSAPSGSPFADASREMIEVAEQGMLANVVETKLPWLFLIYALPSVIVLSITMPPFQVTDEVAHIERADQVSRGTMISDLLGGTVDGSWTVIAGLYQGIPFHPEVKQTVALAHEAGAVRWSGSNDHVNFQNTAQYGPFLYAPQAIGVLFGRLVGLSLARTLVTARMINGFAACVVGALALSICRRGRALTFATLLLPMTLSEFGSASQDALLISLSILAVAMASRALTEQRSAGTLEFAVFAFIVIATTMARPPQFALAFLAPAFVGRRDPAWRSKGLIVAIVVGTVIIWMRILSGLTPPPPPEASLSGQFQRLLANPFLLPTVILNSLAHQGRWLLATLIGCLGWVDTLMPGWYYRTAAGALIIALIAPGNRARVLWPTTLALLTFVALLVAMCASLYVTWTPVGKPTIDGLQGRYILPVLPLLAWAIPESGPRLEQVLSPTWYPVLLFPLMTLAVTPVVIMERYYGSWTVMAQSLRALLLP